MKIKKQKKQKFYLHKYISVLASVVVSFFFVFLTVFSASTISNNIQTDGTLSVTGASTLTGAISASSTLQVTGAVIFYDPVTFRTGIGASSTVSITGSTTVAGAFNVSGAASLASTLSVISSTTVAGALNVGGVARFASPVDASSTLAVGGGASFFSSSTVSGALHISGVSRMATTSLGRTSSSSPAQELSVDGDAYIGGSNTGTTTLVIDGGRADTGANPEIGAGCIQLRAADGLMVRIYASSSPPTGDSGKFGRSNGTSLVVEAGMCQTGN